MRADAEDRGGIRVVEGEALLDGRGAFDEERDRVGADDGRERGVSLVRQRERGNVDDDFTRHAKRLPARGKDPQTRAGAKEGAGEDRGRIEDVFAVVEDEQRALVADEVAERGGRPARRPILESERGEGRLDHERRVLDRRQLDEPDPVRELASRIARPAHGELRLADTARAGERQEPRVAECAPNVVEFLAASYETRQFDWQVAGRQGSHS